jgi:hypothetical protein
MKQGEGRVCVRVSAGPRIPMPTATVTRAPLPTSTPTLVWMWAAPGLGSISERVSEAVPP